jgi:Spy/CpxP family protein refolding chaperone
MKRLSLLAVLALGGLVAFTPATTQAQDDKTPPARKPGGPGGPGQRMTPKERLDKMTEDLKLTDEQKPKVEAILKDQSEKMKALRDDTSLTREDRGPKMKEIMDDSSKKIKAILTPEQQTKYDAMQKEMQDRMKKAREARQNADSAPKKDDTTK